MKKLITCIVTGLIASTTIGCQTQDIGLNRIQAPNTGYIQNNVTTNAVLNPDNINDINSNNITLNNINSGVLVTTLSGGEIDSQNSQEKIAISIQGTRNSFIKRTPLRFNSLKRSSQNDIRHGKSEKDYLNEENIIKNAVKSGQLSRKRKIFLNRPLEEGDGKTFKLRNDQDQIETRTAILVKKSRTAYFWFDKSEIDSIDHDVLEKSVSYWESTAFPVVTNEFGATPMPPNDVDGDKRINIYIGPISKNKGLFGFFSPVDVISDRPESNATDMLYLNSWMFKKGEASEHYAKSTLIHEFQHLVNFNVKVIQQVLNNKQPVFEDRWLNEGLSTLAEQVGGLGLPKGDPFVVSYLENYFASPASQPLVTNDAGLNYGAAYLFVLYLTEQYGKDITKRLLDNPKSGIENIETLTRKPFEETFTDWATAILLSGSGKNSKYDFKSIDLHKQYGNKVLDGIKLTNALNKFPVQAEMNSNNWTINFIKLDNLNNQNLNMSLNNSGKAKLTSKLIKLK